MYVNTYVQLARLIFFQGSFGNQGHSLTSFRGFVIPQSGY